MSNRNQWTAEAHSHADLGLHPTEGTAWCAVTPANDPDAEPELGFVGCKLSDGRWAFPFMDRTAAVEVAADENKRARS